MNQSDHLEWLLHLLHPYPEAWKQHCWARAQELAKDPELAELPAMLAAAMRAKATSTATVKPK